LKEVAIAERGHFDTVVVGTTSRVTDPTASNPSVASHVATHADSDVVVVY
jgi:hypothetical protein